MSGLSHPTPACGRRLLLYFTTQNTHPASCSDDRDDGRVSGQTLSPITEQAASGVAK